MAQFTESKTRCVVVEVSTNQLCVRAQDIAVGESEESLATSYAGEPARIGFNAAYLADFLNRAEHQNVRLLFNDADTATEWQPAGEAALRTSGMLSCPCESTDSLICCGLKQNEDFSCLLNLNPYLRIARCY